MLTDTISEVKKLNATQHLTKMIIPPSTVNVMSDKDNCCFQCQEPGHITQNCPHIRLYECENLFTLSLTVHTKYLLQELQQLITNITEITMPGQVQGITVTVETDKADPDHSLTFEDIPAHVIMIPIEAALDNKTGIDAATTGAAHEDLASPIEATTIDLTMTHHIDNIADHLHIEAIQVINPEIAVGHIHDYPTDHQGMSHEDQVHNPAGQKENHIPRRSLG